MCLALGWSSDRKKYRMCEMAMYGIKKGIIVSVNEEGETIIEMCFYAVSLDPPKNTVASIAVSLSFEAFLYYIFICVVNCKSRDIEYYG